MKNLNVTIKKVDWRVAEANVNSKLIELGYNTFLPFNDGGEIDLIATKDEKLYRIQIKSTSPTNTKSSSFQLCRNKNNYKKNVSFSYKNIDVFILYDGTYFYKIYPDQLQNKKFITLRYVCAVNNQTCNVRMAYDYLLDSCL